MLPLLVTLLGLLSLNTVSCSDVSISIVTGWNQSSFLIQYLEAVELTQPSTMLPFLSLLTSKSDSKPLFSPSYSPEQTYNFLEQRISILLTKTELEILRLSIVTRESSVKIEAAFEASRNEMLKLKDDFRCENWIDWYGKRACTAKEFWEMVESSESAVGPLRVSEVDRERKTELYPFDHLSASTSSLPLAIIYASPTDSSFPPLFDLLRKLSTGKVPRLRFALRWKSENGGSQEKLGLSGFGGLLAIKKTDYLVIDDRAGETESAEEKEVTTSEIREIESMQRKDIQLLGLRAIEYIISCEDVLDRFVEVSSRFPVIGPTLSTLVPMPSSELMGELAMNSQIMPSPSPAFFINGLKVSEPLVNPLTIIKKLRKESKLFSNIGRLHSNFTNPSIRKLLQATTKSKGGAQGQNTKLSIETLGNLFDASDREEGGNLILYWNDLEKDDRYNTWSSSIRDILRPTYPGQLTAIGKNINQVIQILDFSKMESIVLITQLVKVYVARGIPIQFGLIPLMGAIDHPSTLTGKIIWYLVDQVGRDAAMEFLDELAIISNGNITPLSTRKAFDSFSKKVPQSLDSFDQVQLLYDSPAIEGSLSKVQKAKDYATRLAIDFPTTAGVAGGFFMNGIYFAADAEFTNNLQTSLGSFIQFLQQETYLENIDEFTNMSTYFYDLPTTFKRRNQFIFPNSETNPLKIVNLATAYLPQPLILHSHMEGVSLEAEELNPAPIVTIYCVTDLNSVHGRAQVKQALNFLSSNLDARVSFIHNPTTFAWPSHKYDLSELMYLLLAGGALQDVLPIELSAWLDLNIGEAGLPLLADLFMEDDPILPYLKGAERSEIQAAITFWQSLRGTVEKFGFLPGASGLVINGRVIGPMEVIFSEKDFESLKNFELKERISPVVEALKEIGFELSSNPDDRSTEAELISSLTSIVSFESMDDPAQGLFGAESKVRSSAYHSLQSTFSGYFGPNEATALYEIAVVIDPATEIAQKWSAIIATLAKLDTVHIRIYFKAVPLVELPISRFYHFAWSHKPTFDSDEIKSELLFERIPRDVLFSFAADVPSSWVVLAIESKTDLDNIRLADVSTDVQATLELRNLLIEGHARDMPSGAPPRGLQVELSSIYGNTERVGTIVMQNLGYFQLKASPGVFGFSIREGRGREIFKLESIRAEGWKSKSNATTLSILTLEGLTIYPRVIRNVGFEVAELYQDNDSSRSEGVVDKIKSLFPSFYGQTGKTNLAIVKKAEINIFTVASGLLYERMAFLMVVSVLRHTNSTTKFWFIQNFLSPSFIAFIPHMALEYGFEYELVTYNWPSWLRAQSEKQRKIWGYKILLLDVLFPLELERIIFVDSDQIVRADLKELIDMDLQGAPYAYAPMGDDRAETENFRFWKTGYWKSHLKAQGNGKELPYHISALYVVDLNRFRSMGAGDKLRSHYQTLSADKNSLANLDQDLPNNIQNVLPIHTLDRSWLWCETWCSDESLAEAKTIDLCNNPLTHEPKLLRARRIIPEWDVYDKEIAALARRIALEKEGTNFNAFAQEVSSLDQAVEQSVERDIFQAEEQSTVEEEAVVEIETVERIKDEL